MFQSILLSLGQSIINHDNALYISNYYTSSPSLIESLLLQLKCNAIIMLCQVTVVLTETLIMPELHLVNVGLH
jgi:hypothetical protein